MCQPREWSCHHSTRSARQWHTHHQPPCCQTPCPQSAPRRSRGRTSRSHSDTALRRPAFRRCRGGCSTHRTPRGRSSTAPPTRWRQTRQRQSRTAGSPTRRLTPSAAHRQRRWLLGCRQSTRPGRRHYPRSRWWRERPGQRAGPASRCRCRGRCRQHKRPSRRGCWRRP